MLKNYFLVTVRNIQGNKLFSTINIIGLAIGLSACFMIWQYVRFESSFDTFHENKDRLFRVTLEIHQNGELAGASASNFGAIGYAMKTELPEVEDFCRLVKTSLFTSDLGRYVANALEFTHEDAKGNAVAFIEEDVWFAEPSILTMFTFPLIEGNKNALKEPNSVVLTRSIAHKYFGNGPALGKDLRLNGDVMLKVTGVIEDVPVNSHLQFDILISFSTVRHRIGDLYDNWGWSVFYNYVLLNENADVNAVNAKLPALKDTHYSPETGDSRKTVFALQPITDIHLKSKLSDEQSPVGSERIVYFLSILAVFILVVAWINYINLSTSKALQRSREVGLRKTVGATRPQLILQFLLDTAVINTIALSIAAVIVILSWPAFEVLVGKQIRNVVLTGGALHWATGGMVFLAGIILCGVYPALILSSFNPAVVLKGGFLKSSSGSLLRKLMVSFQYVLALLLMAGTVTIFLQLSHMRSLDTGFTKDQVLVAKAPAVFDSTASSRITFLHNELLKIPGVMSVTGTSDVPGRHIVEGAGVRLMQGEEDQFIGTYIMAVDTSFFSAFEIKLLQGRMFEDQERMGFRPTGKELIPVLVNEEFIKRLEKRLGMSDPDPIEERITFGWGPHMRFAKIIGVVANHHQVSLKETIDPVMYVQPQWLAAKYFAVRIRAGANLSPERVQAAYSAAFPGHPFTYFFLDDHFDAQYRNDRQFGMIFNTFTVLAIIVTCLGLLGLSIFSVAQRTKEVSIRKVLGAPSSAILYLFSLDFIRALLISYIIAVPIIWWAGNDWLQNFSTRIPLGWQIFAAPPFLLVAITMITVVSVSLKALVEAPVKALRTE
jgi:putative ABC transport system permease protein